jgi:hypothetical protein
MSVDYDYRLNDITCIVTLFAILMLLFSFILLPVAASNSVDIFPPGGKPYGLTYADHIKNYWKWLLSIPAKDSPSNDATGVKCAAGQSNTNSSVFYLSGSGGGKTYRVCEVPSGKGLLIPVMTVEWSDKESPGATIDELDKAAKKDQDSVNSLYLKIGDKEYQYKDLLKYRTHTDDFEVVFPDNGLFGVIEGGLSKVVADGFYIITEPLAKGNYPIHVKSSLICLDPDCVEPNFAVDSTYNITAK